MNNKLYKFLYDVGIGGAKCPCCGFSRRDRKSVKRRARAKLKNLLIKEKDNEK